MELQTILQELESLGTERTKKNYLRQGAREPLFGVATGAMKPILKQTGRDMPLADALYATGNYDAMYLAGMIADPKVMCEADFDRWMASAYCYMISDHIVSVTLAETEIAQTVSDKWIATGKELYVSAGYCCYCWLLGNRKDEEFDRDKLCGMLEQVVKTIHKQTGHAQSAMNDFVATVGISYMPLHAEAVLAANAIGSIAGCTAASGQIQKAADKGRLGFKRKNVRC